MRCSWEKAFSLLILTAFLMTGCRGDWSYPLLEGYEVTQVNGYEIVLIKKDPTTQINELVIKNYYVVAVCVTDAYILTSGLQTKGDRATNEELEQDSRTYYAIDYKTGEISAPFYSEEELREQMLGERNTLAIDWLYMKDL